MTQVNWDKIAEQEFNSMDKEARDSWSELRSRAE
jgi:hypothetical protein